MASSRWISRRVLFSRRAAGSWRRDHDFKPALSSPTCSRPCIRGYAHSTTSVSVADGGRKLALSCSGEEDDRTFHPAWLRHNCHCSQCLVFRAQKTVPTKALSKDLMITAANIEGDILKISWSNSNGSHTGFLPIGWLKDFDYSMMIKRRDEAPPLFADRIPRVSYSEAMGSDEGLWKWLRELNVFGVCILHGGPPNIGEFEKVCSKIGNMQDTIYGKKFDVLAVESTDNVAYSTVGLPLHMDLPYYQSIPGLQLLYTVKFDECVEGGESILLDAYPVAEEMRRKHPKQFDTLTKIPAIFEKIRFEGDSSSPVECMQYQRPHIALNGDKKVTGIYWSTAHQGPLCVPEHQIDDYYEAYTLMDKMFEESPLKLTHRLQPGEALIFNNHRMLHSRTAFKLNGGQRHLEGCYVSIDDFKNKFMVISKKLGHHEPVRHVLNECWFA